MKTINNFFFLFVASFAFISCSSDSDSENNGGNNNDNFIITMNAVIDGESISLRTVDGSNESNPTGGEFGVSNQLLYGYYDNNVSSRLPIQNKKIEIFLAIPKENMTLGEHSFGSSIQVDEFFAKMKIKINNVDETVNTTSGKIVILSYDSVTNILHGTFELTTNNGTIVSHQVSGSFDYKIIE